MVDWKGVADHIKQNDWSYIVYDDFDSADGWKYFKRHYKALWGGHADEVTVTDKYFKKFTFSMEHRPAIMLVNDEPDFSDMNWSWINENVTRIILMAPLF